MEALLKASTKEDAGALTAFTLAPEEVAPYQDRQVERTSVFCPPLPRHHSALECHSERAYCCFHAKLQSSGSHILHTAKLSLKINSSQSLPKGINFIKKKERKKNMWRILILNSLKNIGGCSERQIEIHIWI